MSAESSKRYTEPKERSAEHLRAALGHMGRHEAAFNPITYTLWYEYAAGCNPKLHAALDELQRANSTVDDATVDRLFLEHVAPVDESTLKRVSVEFQKVMTGIEQSASQTGDRAGAFGAQLTDLSEALQSNDVQSLSPHLIEALAATAAMKQSAEALQRQVIASQNEITRLHTDLDRARGEALLDALTGILNRKGFDQRLQSMLAQPPRTGTDHCLILLDIDHFKNVNDTHGHVMGDRVIEGLGEVLKSTAATPTQAVARYGGEEFAVLLPHSSLEYGTRLAESLRQRAKAMKIRNRTAQGEMLSVTVSCGVTSMREGDDAATLIARADGALYQSKHAGRDRVSCA